MTACEDAHLFDPQTNVSSLSALFGNCTTDAGDFWGLSATVVIAGGASLCTVSRVEYQTTPAAAAAVDAASRARPVPADCGT